MKTIIAIIEVMLYNLFPATLAAPVVIILKDLLPLIGLALLRFRLHLGIGLQRLQQPFKENNNNGDENLHLSLRFQEHR